ncbi:MAG: tetratricopeptide repeat protein [Pseudomonadota bacterium]
MATRDDLDNQILAEGPSAGTAYLILSAWKEAGHFKRVIQEGIKALKVFPSDLRIRKLLGEAYLEAGLIAQAEAEMEKVTALTGEVITVYRDLADMYSRQGRDGAALKALKIYLSHRPDDDRATDLLGRLEMPAESRDGAAPDDKRHVFEIARETEPLPGAEPAEELPEIATPTLAEVYFGQGQVERAVAIYEKVIRNHPEDEKSRQRLYELMSSPGMEAGAGAEATPEGVPGPETEAPDVEGPERLMETAVESGEGEVPAGVFEAGAAAREEKESFDRGREKKKKMLSILEAWRDNIRETSKTPTPA